MGACKDCRRWGRLSEQESPRFGFRGGDVGICHAASSSGGFAERFDPRSLSVAIGDEREGAELITHANFGCVQFEERPEPENIDLVEIPE